MGLALILAGCGPTLRPDPNPYASNSNVPTAEFQACGGRAMGLKACGVRRGAPLQSIGLVVQGYNTGTIRVTSDACSVDFSSRYTGGAPVAVPLQGFAGEDCVLAISVLPEFPGERESAIVIGGLKGFLRVRVLEDWDEWHGYESKAAEGASLSINVPSAAGRLVIRGCGAEVDSPVQPDAQGLIQVPAPSFNGVGSCAYEGVIIAGEEAVFFTWMVWRHDRAYVPAVVPQVQIQGDHIMVLGEPATAAVGLDGEYHVGQQASMSFDPGRPHVVRALTVGGRNVVGEYEPGKGFTWKR